MKHVTINHGSHEMVYDAETGVYLGQLQDDTLEADGVPLWFPARTEDSKFNLTPVELSAVLAIKRES